MVGRSARRVSAMLSLVLPLALGLVVPVVLPVSPALADACGTVSQSGQVTDLSSGVAVLSVIVQSTNDTPVSGSLHLTTSSGTAIGGNPTAAGIVASGSRFTYVVPSGVLTPGTSYKWRVNEQATGHGCVAAAFGPLATFVGPQPVAGPSPTNTVTLTGASLVSATAQAGPTACAGAPCALTPGQLKVGGDGAASWLSTLKPALPSIPVGSSITSAVLNLASTSCLTATACAGEPIEVDEATSDVSAASQGSDVAAIPIGGVLNATAGSGSFDVSRIVADWVNGGHAQDGLVLADTAASTTVGTQFAGPGASGSPASLTIGWAVPTLPSAPIQLGAVQADGGLLVSWSAPLLTGYVADSGAGSGISSYLVTVRNAAGAVVQTQTAAESPATITGLTNGTSYTVSVAATNPVGTGPASATGSVVPTAVLGGPQQYATAVSDLLNAEDQLQAGTYTSGAAAVAGYADADAISGWLSDEEYADEQVAAAETSIGQSDSNDTTSLSNTLASVSSDGSTVTLYTRADETFNTVDASTSPATTVPGEAIDRLAYTFTVSGSTIQVTGKLDEASAFDPVTTGSAETAYSSTLDGPVPVDTSNSVAMDTSGHFLPGDGGSPGSPTGRVRIAYLPAVANWAYNNAFGGNNGYTNDCTDFASRALEYGGSFWQASNWHPAINLYRSGGQPATRSWGYAYDNFVWQEQQGSPFMHYISQAHAGDLIWAAWQGGGASNISHMGVITLMVNGHPFISQHTNDRRNEPFYKADGSQTWQGSNPNVSVWIAQPEQRY